MTIAARVISSNGANKGVSTQPGQTAFTRTPNGATSWAVDFVSAMIPALAAL
jgi:hypothetical protein